ncbi:beta-glucan synthesis-associated protein [Aphanomyces cochlioides]|nr:beta-glucan synthesis-associated protein [Aphanomyces cochlioides]
MPTWDHAVAMQPCQCQERGSTTRHNICDSFPMYMEIDYIRVYQDKSSMFIGCDPPTHPTKKWIDGHIKWYTDTKKPMIRVDGGATCSSDNDCVARSMGYPSGRCVQRRCVCVTGYGGPRCTKYVGSKTVDTSSPTYFGPQIAYPTALTDCIVMSKPAHLNNKN